MLIFHESKKSLNGCRGSSLSLHGFHPTLKKAPEEIGSEVIDLIFTIELMLKGNVGSYPVSSYPICCFGQGGDSSEACSVATATFEVMGLY